MADHQTADRGCDTTGVELIPYEQALDHLLEHATPLAQSESLVLTECLGRILAQDLTSSINVPPTDNSAMDGYAIRTADMVENGKTTVKVSQRIAAGETGSELEAGTAARIFTGAPVPAGADAVIMQEHVEDDGATLSFDVALKAGENIRKSGEDITRGQVVVKKGSRLRAQELGLAASIGESHLSVKRRLRVGIFFTGDELVEPGKPLGPGKIYDSNRYTINGLLKTLDCEIIDLGLVGDTLQETKAAIRKAVEKADLVITSGGVSVGEEDHVRIALEQLGELHMWRLNIKPGKPLAFGVVKNTAFIGLPGNPVSAFATFCLFVSPFIKQQQGSSEVRVEAFEVEAAFDWPRPDRRREFIRARLGRDQKQQMIAEIYHHQGSGVLMSTSWADGFVVIPENTSIQSGDRVQFISFRDMLS